MIKSIRSAFVFFSRLPVGKAPIHHSLSGVTAWLPLVGIVLGLLIGLSVYCLQFVFPPFIVGLLACGLWIILTGGLHLDGVADCGDGLFVETSRERRLEIMKDSRLGTFGGIALFMVLSVKIFALSHIAGLGLWQILCACILATVLGRSQIFLLMKYPSARPGGMGDAVRQGTTNRQALIGAGIAAILALIAAPFGPIAFMVATALSLYIIHLSMKRLGGTTGDIYGCTIEVTECLVLIIFCLNLHQFFVR